jgi:hypothetical protein
LIIALDSTGQQVMNNDQSSCRGLYLSKDILYAACSAGVAVIDRASGTTLQTIAIPGSEFLNDIAIDSTGHVYVSDFDVLAVPNFNGNTVD